MSTPTSQLLSPSSASPDHMVVGHHQRQHHQLTVEPSLIGSSELHTANSECQTGITTSSGSLKTEYKSKFTPFDQYVYNEVTDSFVRPPSASPVAPSLTDHLLLTTGGGHGSPDVHRDLCSRASSTEQTVAATEPWYKEVQRRNEKANEYRFKSEVGHGSSTQVPHCREEYKRDHLISHLANNNNFNLPKDTSIHESRANQSHVSSARSTTRTPAQVRSKSQSTVRRTHASTTTNSSTTKNLNLTPTRAPDRHPIARPSPNVTSSTTRTPKNGTNLDVRRPLNTSASSRTTTKSTAHHQESQARPTSTSRISSTTSKRPTTATLRIAGASRQTTTRQTISNNSTTTNAHRNNLSSTSTRTPTSTNRINHAPKTSSSSNSRTTAPSVSTAAVKSIKTPQAMAVAAAAAATATAIVATPTSLSQSSDTKEISNVKKKAENYTEKSNLEEVTPTPSQQLPNEPSVAVKMEPEEAPWIPVRSSELEEPNNFMFNTTETGNMLADELAEAELQRQKADAHDAFPNDQSYQTNESDLSKSTEEFPQVSKEDVENQMYSIMPVVGATVSTVKEPALDTMSESLEAVERDEPTTEPELQDMPLGPALIESEITKSSDGIATNDSPIQKISESSRNEAELFDKVAIEPKHQVVEQSNLSSDEVESNHPDATQLDQNLIETQVTAAVVSLQEVWNNTSQETDQPIPNTTTQLTSQQSEPSVLDTTDIEEQSYTEDDLNKLPVDDMDNQLVPPHQQQELEHNLLETNESQQPHLTIISDGHQELNHLNPDPLNDAQGDHSDVSQDKEALNEEVIDTLVIDNIREIEEPSIKRQVKPELLMDVNDLLDEEARKKLEMSKKSELARKNSSPLTDVGEVLLSPTQLALGSQEELNGDIYIDDTPITDPAIDQMRTFSRENVDKSTLGLASDSQKDMHEEPAGEVNLLTTSPGSTETLLIDNNTLVGDISNDREQQEQEADERKSSIGSNFDEEDLSDPKETILEEFKLIGKSESDSNQAELKTEKQIVDETVDSAKLTVGLNETAEGIKNSFEKVDEELHKVKQELKEEIEIDSQNNLNFSGHDLNSNLKQNESNSAQVASEETNLKNQDDTILSHSGESLQILHNPLSTNETQQVGVEDETASKRNSVDLKENISDSDKINQESKLAETDKDNFFLGGQNDNINKFPVESESSGLKKDHFKAQSELDLMKQVNMDSGYDNNKHSDDEGNMEQTKIDAQQEKLDEAIPEKLIQSNTAPLADISSDVGANKEMESHGELYRQLHISPNERKLSFDMDKNTLRHKLSSRSSSSTSSSHASSSASSSLERVVQNDIKSDYEELAARMASDLVVSGHSAPVTGDLMAGSSADVNQSPTLNHTSAVTTPAATHQQPAESGTTTTTNLLD